MCCVYTRGVTLDKRLKWRHTDARVRHNTTKSAVSETCKNGSGFAFWPCSDGLLTLICRFNTQNTGLNSIQKHFIWCFVTVSWNILWNHANFGDKNMILSGDELENYNARQSTNCDAIFKDGNSPGRCYWHSVCLFTLPITGNVSPRNPHKSPIEM